MNGLLCTGHEQNRIITSNRVSEYLQLIAVLVHPTTLRRFFSVWKDDKQHSQQSQKCNNYSTRFHYSFSVNSKYYISVFRCHFRHNIYSESPV